MEKKSCVILVSIHGRPSMKGTYEKMKSDSALFVRRRLPQREYFKVYLDHNINKFTKLDVGGDFKNRIIVRWGNRIEVDMKNCLVYNQSKNIENATNKKSARKIFIEKDVNTPKLFDLNNYENATYPLVARPSYHAKGKNFVIINNYEEFSKHLGQYFDQGWYYSEFIDKVQEFRVHCGHGKVLNMLEKPKPKEGGIAWNRALNGEAFNNVKWNDYNKEVAIEGLKAIEALGLDFGGADVILDKEGKAYVLEVNTSPTLASSEYSMERYAKYFDWLASSDKRREHWDFRKFKEVKSLAWKNLNFNNEKE